MYCNLCKYISNNIQMIVNFDEIPSHILNISWLYHFNSIWNVPFMWFHKIYICEDFHSNEHKCVKNTNLDENLFSFERW
jgi:hypothetical protein